MELFFTESDIKDQSNIVIIEDENVTVIGEFISGMGREYVLVGKAKIEDEYYNDFRVAFVVKDNPSVETAKGILELPWETYDFLY